MEKKVKIYFGVTQGKSIYSKLIKWFQWGNPNTHVFYLEEQEVNKKDPYVLESIAGYGVHHDKLSVAHTTNTPYDIYSIKVTPKQKHTIETFLYDKIGHKYDYKGLLGFAFRKDTNNTKKYFCSEYAYQALLIANKKLFRTLLPLQVYPALFVESTELNYEYSDKSI